MGSWAAFWIFSTVFLLIGLGLLAFGLWAAWKSTQAAYWPVVPGKIESLDLEQASDQHGTNYRVKVAYTYSVNGVNHTGSRLAFGYTSSNYPAHHEAILQKLRGGTGVDVRYNPANPAESCLSYGMHRSIQFLLAFAVVWLVSTLGFAMIAWVLFPG